MSFDPCNRSLKIPGVHQDSNSQHGSSLGSVSGHSHTLSHSRASLLACTITSPCLGRMPKAKVATLKMHGIVEKSSNQKEHEKEIILVIHYHEIEMVHGR
jgi:hypothetical protein